MTIKQENNTKFSGVYTYAIGKRKAASAQVRVYKGKGKIIVNGMDYKEYFPAAFINSVEAPLRELAMIDNTDVSVVVKGGGKSAQSEAIRLGISRALIKETVENRPTLKKLGFLTRDSRIVERKKPGKKKARKSPQWAKR